MMHEFVRNVNQNVFNNHGLVVYVRLHAINATKNKGFKIDLIRNDQKDIRKVALLVYDLFTTRKPEVKINLDFTVGKPKSFLHSQNFIRV